MIEADVSWNTTTRCLIGVAVTALEALARAGVVVIAEKPRVAMAMAPTVACADLPIRVMSPSYRTDPAGHRVPVVTVLGRGLGEG